QHYYSCCLLIEHINSAIQRNADLHFLIASEPLLVERLLNLRSNRSLQVHNQKASCKNQFRSVAIKKNFYQIISRTRRVTIPIRKCCLVMGITCKSNGRGSVVCNTDILKPFYIIKRK